MIRMSASLGALLAKPVRLYNIRAGRSKPGLKAQHLAGLLLLRDLCGPGATADGARLDATEVRLAPGPAGIQGGRFVADAKTAGSVCLLAQVSVPLALFGSRASELVLRGGTDADMAPPIDYLSRVFRPLLRRFGADFEVDVVRRGYFPRGGGEVKLRVQPVHTLKAITLMDRGDVTRICVRASVAGALPVAVAARMAEAAAEAVRRRRIVDDGRISVEAYKEASATGNGSSLTVVAETSGGCVLGGSAIGSPKISAEATGRAAAAGLLATLADCPAACVDDHGQDQAILLMSLAAGVSRVRARHPLTLHTRAAIDIAQRLTDAAFEVVPDADGKSCVVQCTGIALERRK